LDYFGNAKIKKAMLILLIRFAFFVTDEEMTCVTSERISRMELVKKERN
jgi:hypothetical protein